MLPCCCNTYLIDQATLWHMKHQHSSESQHAYLARELAAVLKYPPDLLRLKQELEQDRLSLQASFAALVRHNKPLELELLAHYLQVPRGHRSPLLLFCLLRGSPAVAEAGLRSFPDWCCEEAYDFDLAPEDYHTFCETARLLPLGWREALVRPLVAEWRRQRHAVGLPPGHDPPPEDCLAPFAMSLGEVEDLRISGAETSTRFLAEVGRGSVARLDAKCADLQALLALE